jgi:HEAT repeat protein
MLKGRARSKAIQTVIAGTLALLSYLPETDAVFSESIDPFVVALVDEVERSNHELPNRQSVLRRLAFSTSPVIRARVAEAAGALGSEDLGAGLALIKLLSHDSAGSVRAAAARGLAHMIEQLPDALRTAVESEWATARAPGERVVLARALGLSTPSWLTDLAIGELASDQNVAVRRAALQAVGQQLEKNPGAYVGLVVAHLGDADRQVRKNARRALRRAESAGWVSAFSPGPERVRASKRRFRQAMRQSVVSAHRATPVRSGQAA